MSTSYDDSRRGTPRPRVAADAGSSTGATATAGLLTLGRPGHVRTTMAQTVARPGQRGPEASGIEHIVWVMMENRSFDHFLGWLSHANGRQAGLEYLDQAGVHT